MRTASLLITKEIFLAFLKHVNFHCGLLEAPEIVVCLHNCECGMGEVAHSESSPSCVCMPETKHIVSKRKEHTAVL